LKFDSNEFLCDAKRIAPVTFGNDHGNHIYVSQCAPLSLALLFYLFTTSRAYVFQMWY